MDVQSEIKCIFFSEFHTTAGPKIVYQVPENYITKEEFDTVHVYIITKPQLQNKIITVNARGHKIVGCPVVIDNPKYARNALIFNPCLVFGASANTIPYETVVKKLAGYLKTLELESGFLSNDETKERLPGILTQILENMNISGTCCIPVGKSTTIHLKVITETKEPPVVEDQHVPIQDPNSLTMRSVSKWDLATRQLLPYVDGFKHVARIAAEADININIVKACVQNLVHYGAVKLISIFQYSNVYTTTPDITRFMQDKAMQRECLHYVARTGFCALFRDVSSMYCGLTAGTTVRDLCARYNPHSLGIDERKLIQYGLMKNFIRRLQKYPVKLPNETGSSRLRDLYRWFNGCHSYDEICTKTGQKAQDLDDKIENDPSIVICWK